MKMLISTTWQRLLSRSTQDSFFLGSALAAYCTSHGLALQQLAEWLRCTPKNLERLALCRLPNDEKARFQEVVQAIAAFTPCDADRLVILLREVAALRSLGEAGEAYTESLLMAARDRKRPQDNDL